ncbi:FAD-binding and (Fe-S)-binding domain-containing protein [Kutzneria sp. CA-103260]|uniref:FAD-binding and (Fe-S)-binding domain-containing protein n=1 Tax=Kutzneria sp. CA-103260 TaxID=2802641 RepID=UPI001BED7C6A|nr:FAD-binding and (Fe-S)-binding domain-containing protein [Kutzneria sp. CA-103260]QUQ65720.1 FAD-binding oxidoreductase [Kutzneria sp. CA-103260]
MGGDLDARFDDYTRHLFSRDASMYAIEPKGVVFPRSADDVVTVLRRGETIVPRGAGTSLAGQTTGSGLVLDFSRHMNRILAIDPEARTALVEPGVVQDQLNAAAAGHGLMFGPDTSTSNRATIGGMIGNNSAGSGSIRYGMTIDHVRELDVVLADGVGAHFGPDTEFPGLREIVRDNARAIAGDYPAFWRRAGGYRLDRLTPDGPMDLAKFVVGSEGTLVVVTRALVDLVPKPRFTVIAVGHFTSVQAAIEATQDALAGDPSGVELMDRTILDLSRQKIEYAALGDILVGDPEALLFVSFTGDDRDELVARLDQLAKSWQANGHGYHTLRAETPAQQSALLKVRKSSLGLLMAASVGSHRPLAFVEDTAVDPTHLAAYTLRFKEILDRNGMNAGFYGHCSVGCLHIRPFVDLTDPAQVRRMRAVAGEVKDLVAEYGGANSSEHGDGLARSEFNREVFGDRLYEAMRQVKGLFDPSGRLNPGKIVDSPLMTEHLRDPALPAAVEFRTRLDFEVVGGMRGAADRCMNIGLCRKRGSGTMCPSYMATLDEEDSTRGRANALVKALSTPDPARSLGDERLHEILDLCLMCKACKSECPLGVDMATLKSEALSHYHDRHGIPLRTRLFGAIRTLNRLGSATAPLSNLGGFLRPLLGITTKRPLPRFRRRTLRSWFRWHTRGSGTRPVTFLADSFTSFTDPDVGQASIELLELAGYRVRLTGEQCCGRAALSKGLVGRAGRQLRALLDTVGPDTPITGCEPSCLMMLHEQPELVSRVRLIEDLLLEAIDDGRLTLRALPGKKILLHGHCHQKAEVGTRATVELLRRIPGVTVEELDAGCCGMAGSFGFEAEHYDLSMKIGEDRLFPAVRAADAGTFIAATGVSCRQQIVHGTGRTALHPVLLVLDAVKRL